MIKSSKISVAGLAHRRKLTFVCFVSTLVFLALYASGFVPWLQIELLAKDWLARWGRPTPSSADLVFIAIDQASISLDPVWPEEIAESPALERMKTAGWPWPRDLYAQIIERLVSAGARVVAFDMLFPTEREGDAALRKALETFRGRVVIGSNFVDEGRKRGEFSTYSLPASSLVPHSLPDDRVGYVNFWPDFDGVVRRSHYRRSAASVVGMADASELLPSLTARILEKMGKGELAPNDGPRIIRFTEGEYGAFVPLSLYEIFVPRVWHGGLYQGGAYFKDKVVLIGPEGHWSKDYVATRFGLMAGAELHLHALNAALNREFIEEPPQWVHMIVMALGGFGAWLLGLRVGAPVWRAASFAGITAVYIGIAQLAHNAGLQLLLLTPLAALNASGVFWLAWEQVLERIERTRTRRALERYMGRELVSEILDNPAGYLDTLGGTRKPVVVMFSDIRGFTTLSEKLDSQSLVSLLNEYYAEMAIPIFENAGTLDKIVGDSIMALWGNFRTAGAVGDVTLAVKTVLEMRERLAALNARLAERGVEPLAAGYGINYGDALVGNIGSPEKMEFTAMGDTTNLASRLEGLTREYGVDLLLGEGAAIHARQNYHLRLVDLVQVKGKTQPVEVFTVIAPRETELDAPTREHLAHFDRGMEHYRAGSFALAEAAFREADGIKSDDALTLLHLKRCVTLRAHPPEGVWNGVFVMTKK